MTVRMIGADQGPATTAASGINSHAEGSTTTASGNYSHVGGWAAKADALAAWARGSLTPSIIVATRAQCATYTMGIVTSTSSASSNLTMDGSLTVNLAAGNANVLVIPAGATYVCNVSVAARRSAASAAWTYNAVLARDVGGSARIVGTVTQLTTASDASGVGACSITANTTGNYLQIAVLASVANTTSWHAVVQVNELVTGN